MEESSMYERDLSELNDLVKLGDFVKKIVGDYPFEKFEELVPAEVFEKAERVIITGNGDSYSASLALRPFFMKALDMGNVAAERAIDVGRTLYFAKREDPSKTLVFVISSSGTGCRVMEAIQRMTKHGCNTFAVTNETEKGIALDAKYVLRETGGKMYEYRYSGQNFTYTNAMVMLYLVGLYGSVVRGVITREDEAHLREELVRYVESYMPVLDAVDKQMYDLSFKWSDTVCYDFIGTGVDIAAAYFGSAKFFEYCGTANMYTDSEDWNHLNFFMRDREKVGTCIAASKNNPAISRTLETLCAVQKTGSRILAATELDESEFPEGIDIVKLPDTSVLEFKPLMNYIPFTLLGFHIARGRNLGFFTTDSNFQNSPRFAEPDMNKIKTGKIVYID